MKNVITYLKTLWGAWGNLLSNDVRHDRRLTRGVLCFLGKLARRIYSFGCSQDILGAPQSLHSSPSGLDAKMEQKGKMSTSCLLLNSYLPLTCPLFASLSLVSRQSDLDTYAAGKTNNASGARVAQEWMKYAAVFVMLFSIGSGNVWGAAPTTSGLNFGTPLMSEDFNALSTCENTPGKTGSGTTLSDQTAYGIFTDAYVGKSTSLGFGIYTAATPFTTKYLKLLGDGTKVVTMYVKNTSLTTTGAYDIYFDKTKQGYFGLYSSVDNANVSNKSYTVAYCYWDGTNLKISDGNSSHTWQPVGTPTSDLIRVTVIYNASTGNTSYGSSIGISAQKAHVYINGTAVSADGTNPTEFTIQNRTPQYFRLSMNYSGGFSVDDIKVYNALPTAGSCTAPSSVTVAPTSEAGNYGWRYSTGQTIKLTASASGGSGGSYTYQWQKYVGSDWENLTNGGSISGATSANLVISNCTSSNGGSYRCAVSTGATCTTNSDGYFVRVFTLNGNYSGSSFTENAIAWTGENTGTVTLHLTAGQTYEFKVYDNDTKTFGNPGTITTDITTPWGFGSSDGNCSLKTYYEGDYVFTISNLNHAGDSPNPYVSVAVTYPSRTLYLQLCSDWKAATAKYAIYYWRSSTNGWSEYMTTDVCESDIRIGSIPSWAEYCQFVRLDPSGSIAWESKWNKTSNQTLAANKDYLYNVSGTDDSYTGTWGTYTAPTYTISFEGGDGATGSTASHTDIVCDADQTLRANGFSKTGYDFSCWHANKDVKVGGATVTAGSNIAGGATIQNVHEDITLTAQWSIKSYTLTWNLAGGTVTTAGTGATVDATGSPSSSVVYGSSITAPVVEKEGYTFTGWNTTPASTMPASNTTYTAQWSIKSYTVTWYVEGTELTGLAAGLTTVNYGSKVTGVPSPPVSSCEGTFVGWTTSADAVYDKNVTDNYTTVPTTFTTYSGSPTITGNTAFYAVFKKYKED